MYAFTPEHIVCGDPKQAAPELLTAWEACYFDISESRLLKLGQRRQKMPESKLFVVDDGWFWQNEPPHFRWGKTGCRIQKNCPAAIVSKKNYRSGLAFGIWGSSRRWSVWATVTFTGSIRTGRLKFPQKKMQRDKNPREFWTSEKRSAGVYHCQYVFLFGNTFRNDFIRATMMRIVFVILKDIHTTALIEAQHVIQYLHNTRIYIVIMEEAKQRL